MSNFEIPQLNKSARLYPHSSLSVSVSLSESLSEFLSKSCSDASPISAALREQTTPSIAIALAFVAVAGPLGGSAVTVTPNSSAPIRQPDLDHSIHVASFEDILRMRIPCVTGGDDDHDDDDQMIDDSCDDGGDAKKIF